MTISTESTLWSVRNGRKSPWLAALSLVAVLSCGAETDPGNPGSETHWLSECDNDTECGEFSCLCGICSAACASDGECSGRESSTALCVTQDRLEAPEACDAFAPERLCAAANTLALSADSNTGEAATVEPESALPAESEVSPEPSPPDIALPESEIETASALYSVCDGSDEPRLVIKGSAGGLAPSDFGFITRYGWSYLVIDGHCNYRVSTELGRMGDGVIDDPAVLAPYEAVAYGRLTELGTLRDPNCADASLTVFWDPYGVVTASSFCAPGSEPEDWRAVLDATDELFSTLSQSSHPSQGPLRALLQPVDAATVVESVPWPLALDPSPVLVTSFEGLQSWSQPNLGALFQPGSDAEALRAARAADNSLTVFEYTLAAGGTLPLSAMLRDELPPDVSALLDVVTALGYETDSEESPLGTACSDDLSCGILLQCTERAATSPGENACAFCIGSTETEWSCRDNNDCCDGLVCCVDCGEQSGRCLPDPDPCEPCIQNGGAWLPATRECSNDACEVDSACFRTECPPPCASDGCQGCFYLGECWAAHCEWLDEGDQQNCQAPGSALRPEPSVNLATEP